MILPVGFGSAEEGGYQIERSLRFNSADSAYLNKTFSTSPTDRAKKTVSFWYKRSTLSSTQNLFSSYNGGGQDGLYITSGNSLAIYAMNGGAGGTVNGVLRDPSAWYHILYVIDTTQATAGNRLKIWINGVNFPSGAWTAYSTPSLNSTADILFFQSTEIGRDDYNSSGYLNGYLTEIYYIDGEALDETSFGEFNATTGVWQPIEYTGTFGTNGFYLNFSDNSGTTSTTLGKDQAGSNNWTPNNFSVTAGVGNDSMVDTPTPYGEDTGVGGEVRGNYATLNPLNRAATAIPANGNLFLTASGSNGGITGTFPMSSGKWYFELTSGSAYTSVGINPADRRAIYPLGAGGGLMYYGSNGQKYNDGSSSAYGATFTTNNVIGVAVDLDNGKIWWSKDGVWQASGDPEAGTNAAFTGLSGSYVTQHGGPDGYAHGNLNFGQRPFAYTAPSGFKALCTQNLPESEATIVDGGEYFNTVTYSGTGSNQAITVGFQPDFIWTKSRSNATNGYDHGLWDVIRGFAGDKALCTNGTEAEGFTAAGSTTSQFGNPTSITSTNYTVTAGSSNSKLVNETSNGYVAWNWKANGSGVSNTDGTITSTVSANTDAGFSIVTYTGTGSAGTVGHGLGAVPAMIITKNRSGSTDWTVWHQSNSGFASSTGYIYLNKTDAAGTTQVFYNGLAMTSSSYGIDVNSGGSAYINQSGQTYVAYCFAAIPGYSAFGSYTGNNATDGTFVFTGFRPAFLLIKSTSSGTDWCIYDNKRLGYNVDNNLQRNVLAVEQTDDDIDLLSNGFKFRRASPNFNGSSSTHIYMAFAENPFKYSLAR
jgi:hypothetical protein